MRGVRAAEPTAALGAAADTDAAAGGGGGRGGGGGGGATGGDGGGGGAFDADNLPASKVSLAEGGEALRGGGGVYRPGRLCRAPQVSSNNISGVVITEAVTREDPTKVCVHASVC